MDSNTNTTKGKRESQADVLQMSHEAEDDYISDKVTGSVQPEESASEDYHPKSGEGATPGHAGDKKYDEGENDMEPEECQETPGSLVNLRQVQDVPSDKDNPYPEYQGLLDILHQHVKSGKAHLERGPSGNIQIFYETETTERTHFMYKNRICVENSHGEPLKCNALLKFIDWINDGTAFSGVVLDQTKVTINSQGQYREGYEFNLVTELGSGKFGKVVEVKDRTLGVKNAMKTVARSQFVTDEVRFWNDFRQSMSIPKLYIFYLDRSNVVFHMELVQGVTLTKLIDKHMHAMWEGQQGLLWSFSLSALYELLSIVEEMMRKNWCHCDLHGGNIMLRRDSMKWIVIDFGNAQRLVQGGMCINRQSLVIDIFDVTRAFCRLIAQEDLATEGAPVTNISDEKLTKWLEKIPEKEDKMKLQNLISKINQVTSVDNQDCSIIQIDVILTCIKKINRPCFEVSAAREMLFKNQHDMMEKKDVGGEGRGLPAVVGKKEAESLHVKLKPVKRS